MKYRALTIFIVLLGYATAQTLVEKLYIMRSDTTTVDSYAGMTRTCIAVLPDGQYRMERTFQSNQGGSPDTKVYLDKLPPDDLKNLEAALDNPDLEKIQTPKPHGGIIQDMDMLSVSVPREHFVQNLDFPTAAARKPYDKSLKPFYASLKAIQKRKVQPSKTETPNGCEVPRVMYRTSFKSSPSMDPPQQ